MILSTEDIKKRNETEKRIMPQSELDLNLMVTDPVWGKAEVSEGLKKRLQKYFKSIDSEGKQEISIESLWESLGFYTRDMRLANLSTWDGELEYVAYYLDLAHDLLQESMIRPFLVCLSRSATRLEISQSKSGFLRRRMHTFSQENINRELEPPKKSLFGKSKKREGYEQV